jgi:hypothetical protein
MANHPNRAQAKVEATPGFVIETASAVITAAAKLTHETGGSEGYEKARKRALRSARQLMSALKMLGPDGEDGTDSE